MLMYRNVDLTALSLKAKYCTSRRPCYNVCTWNWFKSFWFILNWRVLQFVRLHVQGQHFLLCFLCKSYDKIREYWSVLKICWHDHYPFIKDIHRPFLSFYVNIRENTIVKQAIVIFNVHFYLTDNFHYLKKKVDVKYIAMREKKIVLNYLKFII
jgi:hypothetical protein